MHTTKADTATFLHNGDYSGDVEIVLDSRRVEVIPANEYSKEMAIAKVPFADLKKLVFSYLRDKKISALEDSTDQEFEKCLLSQ